MRTTPHPAKQYWQPCSCARPTASTPDGATKMPGMIPFSQSLLAVAASTPAPAAARALSTYSAAPQATKVAGIVSTFSIDASGNMMSPSRDL